MSARRAVICAMVEGIGVELDVTHLWPFVPRLGDTVEWVEGGVDFPDIAGKWEGTVSEVVVNLDPGEFDSPVWIGLKDERRAEEE